MAPIKEFIFPDRDFVITEYGACPDSVNTRAIAAAIDACAESGGGRVVIPQGDWVTGPVHLRSNVNLYLDSCARLVFTDNPDDYLPEVLTSWEGLECYNYSPLVYALECTNVAITGKGELAPRMDLWRTWFTRPEPHMQALASLYHMGSTDVPVEERHMAAGENHLRPHLIHLNRCNNVLLDGFRIRESPFWTIHLYMCDGAVARNLDVKAHGHNNDGIDLEMTRNVLVENCIFDQGDDAVVIKSGRNRDAWRLNTPSENIVVRDCEIRRGHVLLGIGSEMSGGVRNVFMTNCTAPDTVIRLFFAKTNHRRGGFIENIHMTHVKASKMHRVMEVDTDVLYQWRDLVPTYVDSITHIRGLYMSDITVDRTEGLLDLKGDARKPISVVALENVKVGTVTKFVENIVNADSVSQTNVEVGEVLASAE
ncbi:MAG: glycoside hydrolase family 28 protein [Muribaculaceae bacterium]|nr:glycoside hydrolase family 28 protein [Muribaculaceae bacterium]